MTPIVWTTVAENDLDRFCHRHEPPLNVEATHQEIDAALTNARLDASRIIVLAMYFGFRVRSSEYVLLIDTGNGTAIAKIAASRRLQKEHEALRAATRRGFDGNQVFLRLRAAPNPREPFALLYQTAQSRIDLPDTKLLEEVFVSAVQHQAPTPSSVGDVISELFAAIGKECYERAGARLPFLEPDDIRLNPSSEDGKPHRLSLSLESWNSGSAVVNRRDAVAAFPIRRDRATFIDPVDFFRDILAGVQAAIREDADLAKKRIAQLLPRVLVGCAHGDLHGRNVIVGIRNNNACLPSLFDYENMSSENLLAWDFAKLETELKIRAYDPIWQGLSLRRYAWEIGQFEDRLAERTEQHRRDANWPELAGATPGDRLFNQLLGIRRAAAAWLGRDRPDDWLHEYYFVLAAYGVFTVRYRNQSARERMGAFMSAGVAAARYAWAIEKAGMADVFASRQRLRHIWELNRSGIDNDYKKAGTLAEELSRSLPNDIHVWFELAFAKLKSKDRDGALQILVLANDLFAGQLDEDTFSLWGRWYKDAGDDALRNVWDEKISLEDRRAALLKGDEFYRQARTYYERGYAIDRDRFPGINMATLLLVRGALAKALGRPDHAEWVAKAKSIAADIAATNGRWLAKLDDDGVWMPATLGEALLIGEHWDLAADQYRIALGRPGFKLDFAGAMKSQVVRVLNAFRTLGISPRGPLAAPEEFFLASSVGEEDSGFELTRPL